LMLLRLLQVLVVMVMVVVVLLLLLLLLLLLRRLLQVLVVMVMVVVVVLLLLRMRLLLLLLLLLQLLVVMVMVVVVVVVVLLLLLRGCSEPPAALCLQHHTYIRPNQYTLHALRIHPANGGDVDLRPVLLRDSSSALSSHVQPMPCCCDLCPGHARPLVALMDTPGPTKPAPRVPTSAAMASRTSSRSLALLGTSPPYWSSRRLVFWARNCCSR
jgi:hypothetical protein